MLKLFLGSLYLTIFLFLIGIVNVKYTENSEFLIKDVSFTGEYSMLKDELIKVANGVYGKNMWEVSLFKIKKKLQEDIRIKDVDISYTGVGEINFKIEEKQPMYYVNIKGKTYVADEKGRVFAFINETKIKELPIFYVGEEKEIEECLTLLSKISDEDLKKMISQINYKGPQEINLLLNKTTVIKTQTEVSEKKYNVLRELYLNLAKDKKIEYIDLRFDGYVVKEIGADSYDKRKRDN